MISATDIRYCTSDAYFQIKEVDLGMAADVGTLQRLPKLIGSSSLVRELTYTGRKMFAPEALNIGLVSEVLEDYDRYAFTGTIYNCIGYFFKLPQFILLSLLEKALTIGKQIA